MLLIVNKFKYIVDAEGFRYAYVFVNKTNSRLYANGCQKHLKILTKAYQYSNSRAEGIIPVGTVVYSGYPVKKVDADEWEYQIKTTGELFSGDKSGVLNLISQITKLIEGGE